MGGHSVTMGTRNKGRGIWIELTIRDSGGLQMLGRKGQYDWLSLHPSFLSIHGFQKIHEPLWHIFNGLNQPEIAVHVILSAWFILLGPALFLGFHSDASFTRLCQRHVRRLTLCVTAGPGSHVTVQSLPLYRAALGPAHSLRVTENRLISVTSAIVRQVATLVVRLGDKDRRLRRVDRITDVSDPPHGFIQAVGRLGMAVDDWLDTSLRGSPIGQGLLAHNPIMLCQENNVMVSNYNELHDKPCIICMY